MQPVAVVRPSSSATATENAVLAALEEFDEEDRNKTWEGKKGMKDGNARK